MFRKIKIDSTTIIFLLLDALNTSFDMLLTVTNLVEMSFNSASLLLIP